MSRGAPSLGLPAYRASAAVTGWSADLAAERERRLALLAAATARARAATGDNVDRLPRGAAFAPGSGSIRA